MRFEKRINIVFGKATSIAKSNAAQHSVHPNPGNERRGQVVGVCAFSSSLRDFELVPSKWRCLVPPTRG